MARTTGPLMSLGASGSVAKTITFASWKGRSYVRRLVIPANPKSDGQVAVRAIMRFLSQAWGVMNPALYPTWKPIADQLKASEFNAFTKTNLMSMSQFPAADSPPLQNPTDPRTGTLDILGALTGAGGVGQLSVDQTITTKNTTWGLIVRILNGGAPTVIRDRIAYIIPVLTLSSGDHATATITGLSPGTYQAAIDQFSSDGNLATAVTTVAGLVVT